MLILSLAPQLHGSCLSPGSTRTNLQESGADSRHRTCLNAATPQSVTIVEHIFRQQSPSVCAVYELERGFIIACHACGVAWPCSWWSHV